MSEQDKSKLELHYIKNDDFKTSLVTGIIGSITINSLININFFTDRVTIPRKVVVEIKENGIMGKEIERETREGAIREVQFGALIDISTAKSMIAWLQNKIDIIEKETPKQK